MRRRRARTSRGPGAACLLVLTLACGDKADGDDEETGAPASDEADTDADADADADADGDGYRLDEDCDDSDAAIHPGATETCDGVDNDCDGAVDEAGATGAGTWYADADGDGYGDAGAASSACEAPSGSVADATDCDDTASGVSPGAREVCSSGVDEDCDGLVDCEDGDCAGDPSCVEDCTNGVDDDGDGLTDCEQPDCVGTATCPALWVGISGGTLQHTRAWTYHTSSHSLVVRSLSGTAWARTSAGGTAACDFHGVSRHMFGTVYPTWWATGSGGTVGGSCGLGTSTFLPVGVQPSRSGDYSGFFAWYAPWWGALETRWVSGWYGSRAPGASGSTSRCSGSSTYVRCSGSTWTTHSLGGTSVVAF